MGVLWGETYDYLFLVVVVAEMLVHLGLVTKTVVFSFPVVCFDCDLLERVVVFHLLKPCLLPQIPLVVEVLLPSQLILSYLLLVVL